MALFNRLPNQRVRFAAGGSPEAPSKDKSPGVVFTADQFATLVDALKLNSEATTDDVVATVTALPEKLNQAEEDVNNEIAASAAKPQPVLIDAHVWLDMKRAVERGVTIEKQEHRLAAEQTVDQAIRLGKASPGQRERWIAAYQADPETTMHRLNRAGEVPLMEIGYSMNVDPETEEPKGWVR